MQGFKTEEENGKLKSDRLCGVWGCLGTDTDCGGEPIAGKRVQTRFQKMEEGRRICTYNTMCMICIRCGHSYVLSPYEPVQFQLFVISDDLPFL